MKNTFGDSLSVTLFGESHGDRIGAVLDGLTPGLPVDESFIQNQLSLRRPIPGLSTARVEDDPFEIVSGVYENRTTGTPLCILIPNRKADSAAYEAIRDLPRPGHADYTSYEKYHGFADPRGGGHFSGRITAALVAAGALVIPSLRKKGIRIGTHIARLGGISDRPFCASPEEEIDLLSGMTFAVLDSESGERMKQVIRNAASEGDSVGGILETAVTGLPVGVGEPFFDTMEGRLSHVLFAIPAVKGVEFGDGFALADQKGSESNDPFRIRDQRIVTETNHNGGIGGGITNGMPLLFRCAVKPTPSIYIEQNTVNLKTQTEETLTLTGRHDPAIVHRARVVVDSVTALVLSDFLLSRFGTDWLGEA